jgi:mono/diheme cytochrome c family protein
MEIGMKSILVPALGCVLMLTISGRSWAQEGGTTKDLPSQVRSIFLAKCSECHGRSLSRPRAALYLHDLRQVASNPEWVVPHEPEQSYLWMLLRDDDMPAKGAKAGKLNSQEKEIVRAWIAAGAMVPETAASTAPKLSSPESLDVVTPRLTPPANLLERILAWVGRFHVLVIHFPIALLTTAAFLEMFAAGRSWQSPLPAVRLCVLIGALSATVAVPLGWLHADLGGHGNGSGLLLSIHRWLGTAAGVWSVALVLLSERDGHHNQRTWSFRILLWVGGLLVAMTSHLGGLLVHGGSYFDW